MTHTVATVDANGVVMAVGAGTTYIIFTITGGCSGTQSQQQTLKVNPLPTASITGGSGTICIGAGGTSITGSVTVPSGDSWTLTLSGGANETGTGSSFSIPVNPTVNTTYTITSLVDNTTTCAAIVGGLTGSASVIVNQLPTTANAGATPTGTCGQTTVTLAGNTPTVGAGQWSIISGSGGSFGDQYSPASTFTGVPGTTYDLRWTISNGVCTPSTSDVFVTLDPALTFSLAKSNYHGSDISCATASDGQITVNATGGSGNFMYSDNNGLSYQSSNIFSGLAANTYEIIVKDDAGCVSSPVGITLTAPTAIAVSTNAAPISCSTGSTSLFVTASGGTGSYTYTLVNSGTTGTQGSTQSSSIFTVIPGGPYSVTVTDANNCIGTSQPVTLTAPSQLTAFIINQTAAGCTSPTGSVTVIGSGGTGPYQYKLNAGAYSTTNTFTGLSGNTSYIITVLDAANCTAQLIVTIQSGTPPAAFLVYTPNGTSDCTGAGVDVRLAGSQNGVIYQLFKNNGTTSQIITSPADGSIIDFGYQGTGTYTVLATNPAGCTAFMTGSVTVTSGTAPNIYPVSGTGSYCNGSTGLIVSLSNSDKGISYGIYSGQELLGTVVSQSNGQTINFGPLPAGTYTVQATDPATGCSSTMSGSAVITLLPAPTGYSLSATNGLTNCSGTGVQIQVNGTQSGVSYQLFNSSNAPVGTPVTGNGSSVIYGTEPTDTYTVVGTIINGGCVGIASTPITVASNPAPNVYNVSSGGSYCSQALGVDITLSQSDNNVTYKLINNNTNNVVATQSGNNNTGIDFGYFTTGTYSVTATNTQTGCTSTMNGTAVVTVSGSVPTIITQPQSQIVCAGSTVTFSVTASNDATGYIWYKGTTPLSGGTTSSYTIQNVGTGDAGSYSVTVIGSCGNKSSDAATLAVNPAATAAVIGGGASSVCVNAITPAFTDATAGGVWSIQNGTGTAIITQGGVVTGLTAGTVTVEYTVTGCGSATAVAALTINPATTVASIGGGASSVCVNAITPAFTDATAGGVWSIQNGTGTAIITQGGIVTGLTAGTVTVEYTVTGCGSATAVAALTINPATTVASIGGGASSVCVNAITPAFTDATAGGVWSIQNGTGTAIITQGGIVTGLTAGTVTVEYTVTGCGSATAVAALTINPATTVASIDGGASSVCVNAITPAFTDATAGGVWSIQNGTGTAIITQGGIVTGLTAGTVTVEYTVTGCASATAVAALTINPAVTAATIGGGASTVCVGSTTQAFTDATAGGVWSIQNGTGTAIDNTGGIVTGLTAGTVTVQYTVTSCGTSTATASLTINPAVTAAAIGGGASTVCVGSTTPAFTDATAGGVWSIQNGTGSATISTGGVVTGVTAGTVTVQYTVTSCGTSTATASLTINPAVTAAAIGGGASTVCVGSTTPAFTDATAGGVWSIQNGTGSATISTGGVVTGVAAGTVTVQYIVSGCGSTTVTTALTINPAVTVAPIGGGATTVCVGTTTPAFTDATAGGVWSIQNGTGSATISTGGVVTGVAAGTVTVQYTVAGCGSTTVTTALTINPAVTVAPIGGGATTVCVGTTTPVFTDATAGGVWSIQNGTGSATISTGGVVTGVSAGTVTVQYTVAGCGSATRTASLNINPASSAGTITGITTVCVGGTTQLSDATATSAGTWSSTNSTVATVSSNGFVTTHSAGTATIRYTINNACGTGTLIASTVVTASTTPNVANIGGPSSVCTGSSITLTDATPGGIWNTYNSQVATVSTSGVVTGVSGGNVTIAYIVNSVCGMVVRTKAITVNATPSVGAITGIATVCAGFTTQLSDATAGGQWTSSNTTVATVSTGGLVTGIKAGSVTITYTLTSVNCGTSFATRTVTVSNASSVAAITGSSAVCLGNAIQLTDATSGGIWNTSNGSIATVSTTGIVRGVRAGTVTITYSVSGSCGQSSATHQVTVNTSPVAGTITGPGTLCVRGTITLANTTAGGTWSSTNSSIVTVNSSGVVTGVRLGTAMINYTVTNACGIATARKTVTVNCTAPNPRGFADVTNVDTVVDTKEATA